MGGSPYINRPIEDTDTAPEELEREFGGDTRSVVEDATDDKNLSKADRKRLQTNVDRRLRPLLGREPTKDLGEQAAKGSPFWGAVPAALAGEILLSIGAVPITKAGRVIGAIGCGGGTGEQDHDCAEAAPEHTEVDVTLR